MARLLVHTYTGQTYHTIQNGTQLLSLDINPQHARSNTQTTIPAGQWLALLEVITTKTCLWPRSLAKANLAYTQCCTVKWMTQPLLDVQHISWCSPQTVIPPDLSAPSQIYWVEQNDSGQASRHSCAATASPRAMNQWPFFWT